MKIVGFETETGAHLGVVEGDQVIDLNVAHPTLPRDLAAILRQRDGDLAPLVELA
jgi:hypothetical protein